MDKDKIDNLDWFWIGAKVGLGFGISTGFITVCLFVAAEMYENHKMKIAFGHVSEIVNEAAEAIKPRPKRKIKRARMVDHYVPPKNQENCLTLSDGVADEQYLRCRKGYKTKREETYYVWE